MSFANVHNYPPLDTSRVEAVIGDRILVAWEEKTETLLGGLLVRSQTDRRQHYTGTVLAVGDLVDPEIEVGQRIIFDQFSGFEKYYDEKRGRLAIIEESKQGDIFMPIDPREEVGPGELDFDYEAA